MALDEAVFTQCPTERSAPPEPRAWRDRLGILASSLCAVHCVATAGLLALAPTLPLGVAADERIEWLALAVAVVVGLSALVPALKTGHRKALPIALFGVGALVVLCARTVAPEEGPWELLGATVGAGLMVAGHLRNLGLSRQCPKDSESCCR